MAPISPDDWRGREQWRGVSGVNWHVQILACKFINSSGGGYDSDAITCLDYVRMMKNRGYNIVATNNS